MNEFGQIRSATEKEGAPVYGEVIGNVVLLDSRERKVWFRLNDDFVLPLYLILEIDSNEKVNVIRLDAPTDQLGQLAFKVLEPDQWASLIMIPTHEIYIGSPSMPPAPPGADESRTIGQCLVSADPLTINQLGAIAYYLSKKGASGTRPLASLATITWLNLRAATVPEVERDPKLFKQLHETILRRRIVFLAGGKKSGTTTFLNQYKARLASGAMTGRHLTSEFDPGLYNQVLKVVQDNPTFRHLFVNPEVISLFVALGFSAYRAVGCVHERGFNEPKLVDIVSPEAAGDIGIFVVKYAGLLVGGHRRQQLVTTFLDFVNSMVGTLEADATLTVLLPFERVKEWIGNRHSDEGSVGVLWRSLEEYTVQTYGLLAGTQDEKKSADTASTTKVAIIIELRRLPLESQAGTVLKSSVVILPPFSDDEIDRLWQHRFGSILGAEGQKLVRKYAGGSPWFIDLLFTCIKIKLDRTTIDLSNSIQAGREIALAGDRVKLELTAPIDKNTLEGEYTKIREFCGSYMKMLKSCLPETTRVHHDTILKLYEATDGPREIVGTSQIEDWFETGLFWLKAPYSDDPTLHALCYFPIIRCCEPGDIARAVIEALTSSK